MTLNTSKIVFIKVLVETLIIVIQANNHSHSEHNGAVYNIKALKCPFGGVENDEFKFNVRH